MKKSARVCIVIYGKQNSKQRKLTVKTSHRNKLLEINTFYTKYKNYIKNKNLFKVTFYIAMLDKATKSF